MGEMPPGLDAQVDEALARLEQQAGKRLGDAADPLLVSVRSGARVSMPGMLDTILNLGLNDSSVEGLAERTGNERFARDSHRRLVQMFGNVVREIPGDVYEDAIAEAKRERRGRAGHRARGRGAAGADGPVPRDLPRADRGGVPGGSPRAARAGDPGGVRLLEGKAGGRVPAPERDPRELGDRGERAADGVRQQGRRLRLGGRLQPRRDHGRARALRRLPAQRPGRGRGLGRAQHAGASTRWRGCCRRRTAS